jgi:hypothetical protein
MLVQPALAPVIAGRLLGARRFASSCRFEECRGRGCIERRVVTGGKRVIAARYRSTCIFVDECSRQVWPVQVGLAWKRPCCKIGTRAGRERSVEAASRPVILASLYRDAWLRTRLVSAVSGRA